MPLELHYKSKMGCVGAIRSPSLLAQDVSTAGSLAACSVILLMHSSVYLYKSNWPSVGVWLFVYKFTTLYYLAGSNSHSLAL